MKSYHSLFTFLILAFSLPSLAQVWDTPVTIKSRTYTVDIHYEYNCLLEVNGHPGYCSYEPSQKSLLYTRANDANGSSWNRSVYVDEFGDVGAYNSMQIVSGNPAISYFDEGNGDLKYIRALDADGDTWGASVQVDITGIVGSHTSLQLVNGKPAITYFDQTNGDLKYVRALDATGTVWGTPLVIDATGNRGQYTSLQVIDGKPAVAYYDVTNANLMYSYALDADGKFWSAPILLDATGDVGQYASLLDVNGKPAVAYYDNTNYDLKFVKSNNSNGSGWTAPVILDYTGKVGQYSHLITVNGNPAISYYDELPADLKYIRANNADATSWGTIVAIDATMATGKYSSISIINGYPAICYEDGWRSTKYIRASDLNGSAWNNAPVQFKGEEGTAITPCLASINGNPAIAYTSGNLYYTRATDPSGTTWEPGILIDNGPNTGQYSSLITVNGTPAISYFDLVNGDLKYVRATDIDGNTWGTPMTIDAGGSNSVGLYTSMKIVNGNPAIAYYDETQRNLKYVRANDASGTSWGTPITVASTGDVGYYCTLEIINGNPAIAYGDLTIGDNNKVMYVRATNVSGTTWSAPVTLSSGGYTNGTYFLLTVNGNPAVTYWNNYYQDLKYVRATNADGTTWSAPISPDAFGDVGAYSHMQIFEGKPLIAYFNPTLHTLKTVYAQDASGTSWNTPLTLDLPATTMEGNICNLISMGTDLGLLYTSNKGFSHFMIGRSACSSIPDVPTLSADNNTICANEITTLRVSTGNLNSATKWKWYKGSCGGTYIGSGDAVTVSPTVTTTYYSRGEGGCVVPGSCANITVTVNPLPSLSTSPIGLCDNDNPVVLTGATPAGGTYSGSTINAGTFDPSAAGIGTFPVFYIYTDVNNCTNTALSMVTVNTAPIVSHVPLIEVCINSNPILLNGGTPVGGTYNGGGIANNYFDPTAVGIGTTSASYTYTNANQCSASVTTDITVHDVPNVSISALSDLCDNAGIKTLTEGLPSGGTYSGNGISGNSFNPAIAGTGSHTITYSYTDENQCSNTAATNILVNAAPDVTLTAVSLCDNLSTYILSEGSPAGGTYSGTAVSGNTFNVAAAGPGNYTLSYSYTDANNCSNLATATYEVSACTNLQEADSNPVLIYPNPSEDNIIITFMNLKGSYEIMNSLGVIVLKGNIETPSIELNLSNFGNGLYVVRFIDGNMVHTKTVVIR